MVNTGNAQITKKLKEGNNKPYLKESQASSCALSVALLERH